MKAEMNLMNLLNAKGSIPDKKESDISMRNRNVTSDKIDNYRDDSLSGSEHYRDAKSASFKETYDTANNAGHAEIKDCGRAKRISVTDDGGKRSNKKQHAGEMVKNENLIASEAAGKKENKSDKMSFEQARKIILDSLAVISEKLNLNINYGKGLSDLDFNILSDAVLEQFTEILYALKGISQLLENAVAKNVALEVKGIVIEPQDAAALEQSLRVELFRLQVALKALGVAGDVSRAVALKMNAPVNGGIPQATVPSSLSMPESQLQQLLGNLMENNEDHIKSVIERITALANAQNSEAAEAKMGQGKHITGILKEENNELSLRVTGTSSGKNSSTVKPADLCPFDPQVMRHLLKIDEGGQKPNIEETSAGKPAVVNLSSGTAMSLNQNFQQALNASLSTLEQVSSVEANAKGEGQPVDISARFPAMPLKSMEESVMIQVMQRMNMALKSGMHEIRLVLRPESLGNMRMTIQMDGDVVMARITVENQQVKQIIESNLQNLRNSLAEQNLQAGAFDVNVNKGSQNEERGSPASEKGLRAAGNAEESANEPITNHLTVGTETGRRFGSNTIEYFA